MPPLIAHKPGATLFDRLETIEQAINAIGDTPAAPPADLTVISATLDSLTTRVSALEKEVGTDTTIAPAASTPAADSPTP